MLTKKAILILFFFVAFFFSFQNPSNHQKRFTFAFASFRAPAKGFATFTQINSKTCRGIMQWNTGFTSKNTGDYTFKIGSIDITSKVKPKLKINPPGTAAIQIDFSFKCDDIIGKH